jgi:hypothetical protein
VLGIRKVFREYDSKSDLKYKFNVMKRRKWKKEADRTE